MTKTITSSDNIHSLHYSLFTPEQNVKATLLIVHGMAEHSGRYHKFAQYLADQGIAVLTYDQLGHGRTANHHDDLGFIAKKHPMQLLMRDVVRMADELKQYFPEVPHFIMGHSMGSFIVRNVLQHHSSTFAGAIIMGTSDTDPLVDAILPLTNVLNRFKPKQKNKLYSAVTNALFNHRLNDRSSNSKFAWLCKDKDSIKAYESDPLCGFELTNNGYYGLLSLMKTGLAKDWADTIDFDFPMLFISGDNDPVGNMGKGKGIRTLTKRLNKQGFNHITEQLYSGMRHEPLHEQNHQKVYADILQWIEQTANV